MRAFLVLAAATLELAACSYPRIDALGGRSFAITVPYEFASEGPTRASLDVYARHECPNGYERLDQHNEARDGGQYLTWTIRCT